MKPFNFSLQILILFFFLQVDSQELEINSDFLQADIHITSNIHIFNTDSDIVLSGDFFTHSYSSVHLEPRNGYSITIIPALGGLLSRVGIEDDEERPVPRVTIYPNPTFNTITINITTQEAITSLELYDNYGIQQTNPTLEDNNVVNLSSYANGMYILKIHLSNGEILTETIVKN